VLVYHLDIPVGFALYFYNFSTFKGKKGLYLEDLFILPDYRGLGFGKAVFEYLIGVAKENNCGRMEWVCLDWNKPAIEFYLKKNAVPLSDWTTYRIDESDFEQISCQTITHLLK
jgi:GNAT superfamily N-acetyltransferase